MMTTSAELTFSPDSLDTYGGFVFPDPLRPRIVLQRGNKREGRGGQTEIPGTIRVHPRFSAGVMTSSRPYPSMAKPSTTTVMKSPGGPKYHQWPWTSARWTYDSLTRTPQLLITSGPDAPRPKKERKASVKTEFDTVSTASAQTRGITFGIMCLRTMKPGRAPIARDRSMN